MKKEISSIDLLYSVKAYICDILVYLLWIFADPSIFFYLKMNVPPTELYSIKEYSCACLTLPPFFPPSPSLRILTTHMSFSWFIKIPSLVNRIFAKRSSEVIFSCREYVRTWTELETEVREFQYTSKIFPLSCPGSMMKHPELCLLFINRINLLLICKLLAYVNEHT